MDKLSSPRRELRCRLCFREYSEIQLEDIFAKGSKLESTILSNVGVKPSRHDHSTQICINCKNIVSLIECFKEACIQSEVLLTKTCSVIKTDTWEFPNSNVFKQAKDLIDLHREEINSVIESTYKAESDPISTSDRITVKETEELYVYIKEEECEEQDEESISYLVELDEQAQIDTDENNLDNAQSEADCDSNPDANTANQTNERNKNRQEKVVCPTCGELVSQQVLEGHLNRHLGVQPFSCDFEGCDAKLYSKFALQQHRSRHKSANRYFDCNVCGKRIKGTAYWLIHRKLHTDEPRFSCDICGKRFRRKCKLKLHSTVHTGIAEFPCAFCGKFFKVKHNRTAHYKTHIKNGTHPVGLLPDYDQD
ncbi:zinc finger protein 17-like [Malaya genurostris]|uniref:zinc finger protein 17-like n=1 Tax=Malaya genurostris TaxID=325434 RepID=UPI0026F3E1A4|nr:zinc finger protein 17-like [Malaya genurostris]XP_058443332.1 zinc finger protein 17-like [Malaya genurostris]